MLLCYILKENLKKLNFKDLLPYIIAGHINLYHLGICTMVLHAVLNSVFKGSAANYLLIRLSRVSVPPSSKV
jgi:hypothetical protein